MPSRILVGTVLLVSVVAGSIATSGASARQSAVVNLTEPTLIGSTIVQGPVFFTHDKAKMARGEPCTSVSILEPAKGPAEEITSFHCIPAPRKVVNRFTIRTRPNSVLGFGCILTEYQFAGEAEGHGVPTPSVLVRLTLTDRSRVAKMAVPAFSESGNRRRE